LINSTPAGGQASPGDGGESPDRPARDAVLTISEVSQRTGIPPAGLRNWEQRYGLLRPQRSPSGQRRYTEADCVLLGEVLRLRESGLSIPAAMAQAAATVSAGPGNGNSIFAGLRRGQPGLQVHVMTKTALLALTHAIEDESCARAQRPVLIGAFQQQRYYQSAQRRWADLATSAVQTIVFADFPASREQPGPVAEIGVPASSPLRREWALVCDAPDHPACVAGWERPGQEASRDRDRVFEAVWSADPQVVRTAARIGTALAAADIPDLTGRLAGRLSPDPGPGSADLRRASGLLERTLDYLTRSS
jgi:MerR family transcriptional regulator, light-induced transcriptional regulator